MNRDKFITNLINKLEIAEWNETDTAEIQNKQVWGKSWCNHSKRGENRLKQLDKELQV